MPTTGLAQWVGVQAALGGQDRSIGQAFTALQKDVKEFSTQQGEEEEKVSYQVNNSKKFVTFLHDGREANCTKLYEAKKAILEIANKLPDDDKASTQERLRRTFLNRKVLTMKSLLMNFATQRPEMLVRTNPALSDDDIQELYNKIGDYLALAVHEQQRERAISEHERSKAKAAEALDVTRCYDPNEHPEYLVFEQTANIIMRPQQVENLKNIIAHGDKNPIMEMIMGSGKSKVLLPLLALMRADGDHLAVLIVPQQLFESVAQDTQASIGDTFGQQLKTLHFDRNTTFTPLSLEHIRDLIVNVKKERQALIMTSKSMQCLLLKYIEIMDDQVTHGGRDKEAELMTEIIALIKQDISPTLDEIDTLLNVLHEVSFSIGDAQSPVPWETSLTSQFYRALLENDELKKLGRLEIDSNPNLAAPPITEDVYKKSVMPALAEHLMANLTSLDIGDEARNTELHKFTKELNDQDKENLKNYITRNEEYILSAQQFFTQQSETIQDFLALAAEEITSILPHTLTRCVNENYGVDLDSQSQLAIPFGGPNNPKKGSQFLSPHVTMAYTFQYYLYQGISEEMVKKQIAQLQSRALEEVKDGDVLTIPETKAWLEFCKIRGLNSIPLFKYTPGQLSRFTNELNSSVEKKCFFVENFIIPTLEVYPQKISCNPLNLMDFFPGAWGFTGTLWNSASMHRKLQPNPAAGTDAKTLSILWNNSYDKVRSVKDTRMDTLIKALGSQNFQMIADAGAYFKEKSNEEVAKALSEARSMPCVFYNVRQEQCIWMDGKAHLLSEVDVPAEGRITFLDQSHCTGSDVTQKPDAFGFVTIGPNMLTRDLLQSVWRLRGLAEDQRVEFVLSKDVKKLIRGALALEEHAPIHFPEILSFTMLNQVEHQGRDNFKSLTAELAAYQQSVLFNCLTSETLTAEEKKLAVVNLRNEWIKPSIIPPRKLYGKVSKLEDAQEIAIIEGTKTKEKMNALIDQLPFLTKLGYSKEAAGTIIDEIVKSKSEHLPDKVTVPKQMDEDQSVEVETETEVEQEQQIEIELEELRETHVHILGTFRSYGKFKYCEELPLFEKALKEMKKSETRQAVKLEAFMESREAMQPVAKAFDDVYVSVNFFNWEEHTGAVTVEELNLLGSYRKPIHHVLFSPSGAIVLPVSDVLNYSTDPNLVNITNDVPKTEQEQTIFVKLKFLDGQSHFNKKERKVLRAWLKENDPEKMKKFFIGQVLNGKPDKAARFQGSDLMKVFLDLT